MKIVQGKKLKDKEWEFNSSVELNEPLVLVFGNRYALENVTIYKEIKQKFPDGHIVFGSTSGEILSNAVYENSLTLTAIEFEKSRFTVTTENILNHNKDAKEAGASLVKKINKKKLKHLFIISEGSFVNGSDLIQGVESDLTNNEIAITGGLCGDDARFEKTLASYNENPKEGEIVAIAFYGDTLEFSFANYGGWSRFGPERIITRSSGNILCEVDGMPALDLYKKYLGDKAKELPQAALLYPLSVKSVNSNKSIVRTILNIDEEHNCMILAGDVPVGSKVQLMMATVDNIANGAQKAATLAMQNRKKKPELALLVSCVGRKLVMDQRVEEEIEEVQYIIGKDVAISGFYSYGEMAPFATDKNCILHNQTMTLTLISE
ncbi:FIST signal transduction protein [Tenacibaculum sp. IB213877]|uniref:FIST signal transduction protein n=1 Tax=Tenacibaculum sp. IB213877 TaxID=3097351 RepID=UPI002A5A20B5|nr:FIST N-terminal domain-containing protein [Tenacibaculum sp. IB213877]MDY0781510.1 FIST C-terminal domain-containing protein [Tenacibaculum sp. IB213877]